MYYLICLNPKIIVFVVNKVNETITKYQSQSSLPVDSSIALYQNELYAWVDNGSGIYNIQKINLNAGTATLAISSIDNDIKNKICASVALPMACDVQFSAFSQSSGIGGVNPSSDKSVIAFQMLTATVEGTPYLLSGQVINDEIYLSPLFNLSQSAPSTLQLFTPMLVMLSFYTPSIDYMVVL